MKRDMDLVRSLLLYLEQKPGPEHTAAATIQIEGREELEIQYHLNLLYQAGMINGEAVRSSTSDRIIYVLPFELTWTGHEFLESVRDPEIWRNAKATASTAGTAGADFLWGIAKELVKRAIRSHTGLDIGN